MSNIRTIDCSELEHEGQLLRFEQPLQVEVQLDEDGTCSLNSPLFDLSAAGANEAEAWEMFSDLIISTYLQYHAATDAPRFQAARKQWESARGIDAKFYVLQPV